MAALVSKETSLEQNNNHFFKLIEADYVEQKPCKSVMPLIHIRFEQWILRLYNTKLPKCEE